MPNRVLTGMRAAVREHGGGVLILGAYALLAAGVLQRSGFYDLEGLKLVLTGFCFLVVAAFGCAQGWLKMRTPSSGWLAAALVLMIFLGMRHIPGWHIESAAYVRFYRDGMLILLMAVLLAYLEPGDIFRHWRKPVFVLGAVFAIALRGGMIFAAPSPMIDTFAMEQEGAAHLLQGGNPYLMEITDVYEGKMYFGYTLEGYTYPPADLYPRVIAYALAGDVRWVSVVAEIVMAVSLWLVGRRHLERKRLELLVLLFLYHPRGLFVLEEAWTEPLIVLLLSLFILSHARSKDWWAALAFGYMIALKQYLVFFILHWLLLRKPLKHQAASAGIAFLTFVPFLLWDAEHLIANGILFNVSIPFRTDSLTIAAYLFREYGIETGLPVSIGIGALASALSLFAFRRMEPLTGFLFAGTLSTFSMFLLGHQAFCNYYYFVGALLIWLLASMEYRATARQAV